MMTTKRRFTVTVKQWRMGHDFRTIDEPATTEVVEVEINMERIAQSLGPKACRSKGKRAQAMSGLVVARKV